MDTTKQPPLISEDQVRAGLRKILASPGFFRAPRMQRFLTFVVEGKLTGQTEVETLKESVIGHTVFDREPDYDPKSDPVVRVEARRLRSKLEEYYDGPGREEPIRIDIPKGTYVPVWDWQKEPEPEPEIKLIAEAEPATEPQLLKARFGRRNKLWLLGAGAVLLALGFIAWRRFGHAAPAADLPKIRSIAVLPFQNFTGESAQEYLVAGLTDEITTALAKIGSLKVISRTSAQQYRTSTKSLPQIARELKVDAVVEGSVSGSSKHYRVTAQLIRAANDMHIWADSYDRRGSDLFLLQSEISQTVAHEIGATLQPSAEAQRRVPAEAYDLYLQGRYWWNKRTLEGLEKAIAAYERALVIDPNYAKAYAALGDCYILLSSYGGDPGDAMAKAKRAAEAALRLDGNLAEAHTVLAAIDVGERDFDGATAEYRRAIDLDPNYPTAHHWYSIHLSRLGRHAEAIAEMRRAQELDPMSLIIGTDLGETYYWARQPDAAIAALRRVLELDPQFGEAHMVLGKTYEMKHDWAAAMAEFKVADPLLGHPPSMIGYRAHALALSGNRKTAEELTHKLAEVAQGRYVSDVIFGFVYCALGNSGRAMQYLQPASVRFEDGIDMIGTEPLFDGCRADPNFQQLLKRLKISN